MHQHTEADGSVTHTLTHGDNGIAAIDDDKVKDFVKNIKNIAEVTVELDPVDFCGTHIQYDSKEGRLELLMDVPISDAVNHGLLAVRWAPGAFSAWLHAVPTAEQAISRNSQQPPGEQSPGAARPGPE